MPVIYIPCYENGQCKILEIVPRWNCFQGAHGIFIDGYHFYENQLFRTREAVSRYWAKLPVSAADHFTIAELVKAWEEVK